MRRTLLLVPFVAAAFLATASTAGEDREPREPRREETVRRLRERLTELQRRFEALREAPRPGSRPGHEDARPGPEVLPLRRYLARFGRPGGADGRPSAGLEARVARLEEENRRLRGELGEMRQHLRRVTAAMGEKGRARLEGGPGPGGRAHAGPPGERFESHDDGRSWSRGRPAHPPGPGHARPGGDAGREEMRRALERARERLRRLEERLREREHPRGPRSA